MSMCGGEPVRLAEERARRTDSGAASSSKRLGACVCNQLGIRNKGQSTFTVLELNDASSGLEQQEGGSADGEAEDEPDYHSASHGTVLIAKSDEPHEEGDQGIAGGAEPGEMETDSEAD